MKLLRKLFIALSAIGLGFTLTSATVADLVKNKEKIKCTSGSTYEIGSKGEIKVDITYVAKKNREIVVALHNRQGKWVASRKTAIKKGSKSITLSIKSPKNKPQIKPGSNYEIRYHLRPKGTTWKAAISKGTVKGVVIK